ncbi:ABC transporter permease [Nocardiopsis changdeensis]|uniref:Transport permease protein n=1 Tax=Nocardiopsis changdeensis TaxID=2831969 RepID=A0ABX8BGL6_9ACTN|nr:MULTISPECIES: ABC transporter permease [Nocardiopsis]QUX20905.1 ABC transporter permease [Nocardiopsis changdeensis]QYX36836.1 ABC transporter permease [Nocardiopsis sp. MT53]
MTAVLDTPPGAAPARPAAARPGKVLSDTLVLTRRNLLHMVRSPFEPGIAVVMPVVMVLLFGFLFDEVMSGHGAGSYREFLVPAMLAMVMVYGVAGSATGTARDVSREVMGRFRSMPMSPVSLLTARTAADMVRACLEVALLLPVGLLLGWRAENGPADAALAIGLLLFFRLSLVWLGVLMGLVMPDPDASSMIVYPLAFPLTMLSTAFLPADAMPSWMAPIAEWNPLSAVVSALRELFGNADVPSDSWPADHAGLLAVAIPAALLVLCVPLSLRRFRALSR